MIVEEEGCHVLTLKASEFKYYLLHHRARFARV